MATAVQPVSKTPVTRQTIELLLDLVEIKLGCVEVYDREDAREFKALERARLELNGLLGRKPVAALPMPAMAARPGRRPALARAAA